MEIKNNFAGVHMNFRVTLNVHRMRRRSKNPETHVYIPNLYQKPTMIMEMLFYYSNKSTKKKRINETLNPALASVPVLCKRLLVDQMSG